MSHPIEDRSNELFATSSDLELLSLIRECLDTEDPFPFEDETRWSSVDITLAFAEVLVLFFAALPNGMVPSSAYPIITGAAEEDDSELLEHLSPVSVNVWVTLFAFLQFACLQTSRQEVEAKRIASVFAPVLIKTSQESEALLVPTPRQKRGFVKKYLLG